MSVTPPTEPCEDCGTSTPHDDSVEIRDGRRTRTDSPYARQPYRVAVCLRCGVERARRVNAA